ncbi:unnamed protein product, partial [Allacma fusca]
SNPRFKLEFFKNVNWKKELIESSKKIVVEVWGNKYKVNDVNEGTAANPKPSTSIFDNMFRCATASKKNLDDDLTRYFTQKPVHAGRIKKDTTGSDGALDWWKVIRSSRMIEELNPVTCLLYDLRPDSPSQKYNTE